MPRRIVCLRRAIEDRLPLIAYAEGGGGRPGDVDLPVIAGLEVPTFRLMAQMSGRAPTVAVVAGYCFAGNAVLAACADVIIATEDSNLGAGGPAMIEGGGLGTYGPTDIGPIDDQVASGVVDIRVADESAATRAAKQYLSYFQGRLAEWECADQALLREVVPAQRKVYDVRRWWSSSPTRGPVLGAATRSGVRACSPPSPGSKAHRSAWSPTSGRIWAVRSTPSAPPRLPGS
jgi:acetyl-CoA carboxylase carboxyltransferase component